MSHTQLSYRYNIWLDRINSIIIWHIDNRNNLNSIRFTDVLKNMKWNTLFFALITYVLSFILKYILVQITLVSNPVVISVITVPTISFILSFIFIFLNAGLINRRSIYTSVIIRFVLGFISLAMLCTVSSFFGWSLYS